MSTLVSSPLRPTPAGALRSLSQPAAPPQATTRHASEDEPSDHYSAGKVLTRAALGAIGGAITVAISGGGILSTALWGAGVYGLMGAVTGAIVGGLAGAATGHPGTGAAVGAVTFGSVSAAAGFVKGAILGGLTGLFGGGPLAGAVAGGLLSAAGF
jgi:hypothetical protein